MSSNRTDDEQKNNSAKQIKTQARTDKQLSGQSIRAAKREREQRQLSERSQRCVLLRTYAERERDREHTYCLSGGERMEVELK